MTYTINPVPRPETIDDEHGMAQYELTNEYGSICYLWIPTAEMPFFSKLLNAQAEKAWDMGAEAMCGQDNGGPMAENPFTVQSDD